MEFHSGAIIETHDTVAYQSLGASRNVMLVYDSLRADPRPIVHVGYADVDPAIYSVPSALRLVAELSVKRGNFQQQVPGHAGGTDNLTGGEHFWQLPSGRGPVDAALQVDLRDQPSGKYDYTFHSGILGFAGSRGYIGSSTDVPGEVLHVNGIQSFFGSGWGIAGLVHLVENPDGSVLWIDGDGTEKLFARGAAAGTFVAPPGEFSTLTKPGGLFQLTTKEQIVSRFDAAGRIVSLRDPNGNETRFEYDGAGVLARIVDPVGLATVFASASGKITSITDPAGRVTQLAYDAAGNLTRITDPDHTARQFEYDGLHHMTGETDKRGNRELTFYDFAGRNTHGIRKDGSVIRVSPAEVVGLFPADQTADPNRAPAAARTNQAKASYVDGRGNVSEFILDAAGQLVSGRDAVGPLPGTTRNEANVIASAKDSRGHTTGFRYDAFGNVVSTVDEISAAGVLALYTFEGDASDVTGGGHDGVVTGATIVAGQEGSGFRFDGFDDFIELPLNINPSAHPKLTMGAWVKAENGNPIRQVVSHTNGCFDRSIGIDFRGGGVGWSAFTGNGEVLGAKPVTVGDWTFVAAVYDQDAGTVTFYVNGESLTENGTLEEGFNFVRLGANPAFGEFFAGTIDNVFFIADALTPAKIAAIRAGGAGAVLTSSEGGKSMTYDAAFNRMTTMTDEVGRQTVNDIDPANGNLRSITQVVGAVGGADDVVTRFTYTVQGLIDTVTDPLGRVTDFDYDVRGRLITLTTAKNTSDQGVTRVEYDNVGNITAIVNENGQRSEFVYDMLNRPTRITSPDPDGAGPLTSPIVNLTYDAAGNLVSQIDSRGNSTRLEYDALQRVVKSTDALGGVSRLTYDAADNVIAAIDELGRETRLSYDARDRVTEQIDATGGKSSLAYDLDDRPVTVTDELGRTTRMAYDARGRLAQVTDARSQTMRMAYSSADDLVSITDRLGRRTTFAFDELGRQTTQTDPLGGVSRMEYDAASNVVAVVDELGRRTQIAYDARDRLRGVTNPLGGVVQFGYDAVGNLTSFTDELNRSTAFGYDGLNRQTRVTDPLGGIRAFAYDSNGNLVSTTDELNRTTRFEYDALNRRTHVTDPLNHATQFAYDAVGNVTSLTDPLGHITQYVYDVLNRPTRTTDARGGVTRMDYDAVGNQTKLVDPVGNATTFAFDELDRMTTETNALGAKRQYGYDAEGNLTSFIDRNGRRRSFDYDALDRRVNEKWLNSDGSVLRSIGYSFDAASQMTGASDPDSTYGYTFDAEGRLTNLTNAGTRGAPTVAFTYAYDAVDNMLSRNDSINGAAAGGNGYQYDALNRVTRITQSGTGVSAKRVDLAYDAASQLTGVTRFADLAGTQLVAASNFTFDVAGRLTNLTHAKNATTLAQYSWTFDDANRITRMTSNDGTTNYNYDDTNQLTAADHSFQTDEAYNYDLNGNRTNAGFQTGANNRLTSDGTFNYTYDAEGNRTRRTNIATGAVTEYEWDYRNRLVRITEKSAGGVITRESLYTYDVFDRRIAKSVDADGVGPVAPVVERFVYDGPHIALTFDGAGNETHRYLHGPMIDQVLADENALGEVLWPLADHQNTVRDLVDSAGTVVNHIAFDSFGAIASESNASLDHLFAYTGREADGESGLMNYRERFYDPKTGQFLSEDPLSWFANDTNLVRYVGNNSPNAIDPNGEVWSWGFALGGAAISTTSYVLGSLLTGNRPTRGGVLGAAAGGFAAGSVVGVMTGDPTAGAVALGTSQVIGIGVASGAVGAVTSNTVQQVVDTGRVDVKQVGWNGLAGAIGGGLGSWILGPNAIGASLWRFLGSGAAGGAAGGGILGLGDAWNRGESIVRGILQGIWQGLVSGLVGGGVGYGATRCLAPQPKSPATRTPSTPRGPADTPVGQQAPTLPDDAVVFFSPESYSEVRPGAGGDLFTYRFGDIRHLTPKQIQGFIGEGARAGQKGGTRFMHVLDTSGATPTRIQAPMLPKGPHEPVYGVRLPVVKVIEVQPTVPVKPVKPTRGS